MAKAVWRPLGRVIVGVLAGSLAAVSAQAQPARGEAHEPAVWTRFSHVRGLGSGAYDGAGLLAEARVACPTVQRLLDTLQQTDVMVVVGIKDGVLNGTGHLTFMGTAHGTRWLRITIERNNRRLEQIAWLAHELRHAVEVAAAPEVQDTGGLRRLYERIGRNMSDGQFETDAAVEAGRQALDEAYEARGRVDVRNASVRKAGGR